MQCSFCQQDMQSQDNGKPGPRLSMIWICKKCPQEVRVMAEKDTETEQHWLTKHVSIFIKHRDKEYCLHWNYINNTFEILDLEHSNASGMGTLLKLNMLPTSITPTNAYEKFLTYLIWS